MRSSAHEYSVLLLLLLLLLLVVVLLVVLILRITSLLTLRTHG